MYDNNGPIIISASEPEYVPKAYTGLQCDIARRHVSRAIAAIRKPTRGSIQFSYEMLLKLTEVLELLNANQS